jgi:hypothetical protein
MTRDAQMSGVLTALLLALVVVVVDVGDDGATKRQGA